MNTAEPSPETEDDPLIQLCPTCDAPIDISDQEPLSKIACPACGALQYVSGQVDKFDLQEVVGRGGMGVVYKAYDQQLDRHVALKLLRRDKSNRNVVAQLQKEAQITASITHPHVVRVFTSGTDHGRFFIAMELVDKGTLDDLIHLQGRVAETQVLEVGSQIAQGLRAALQAGLIHRDVKPGNILFADSHTAKIVDFGLAIFQSEEESQRGEIWGTPYYVAPEKLDQKPEDFRSDIYSLGGTLFHALAGRPPFEAEDASMVALKHLKSQAVSLQAFAPNVSGQTAYVINRTLAKDPNDRYQSYDELIEHLNYALEQLKSHGGQAQPKQRVVMEGEEQQRAMGWITTAMIGLMVLAGIGVFAFRKTIFGGGGAATPGEVTSAKKGPALAAREKLVAGDTAGAIELFSKEKANSKLPPLEQSWASVGEGIGQLIAGEPSLARRAFETVSGKAKFKTKGEDEKTDAFLRDLSKEMAASRPYRAAEAQSLNLTNHEAFGLFAYGVKDWSLGKMDDAASLLRNFAQKSNPAGNHAWISDFKPLASKLLEEQTTFQMAADRLKLAKRPEDRTKALAELRKSRGPFKQLAADLEKSVPAPAPPALPKLGDWTPVELGTPSVLPKASVDPAGVFTIQAGGADLWGNSDSGLFIHRIMEGDFQLIAQLQSVSKPDAATKAGVMIRESLKADSRNVALVLIPDGGLSQQVRAKGGDQTTSIKTPGGAPHWLKLVRKGDAITGFRSTDGKTWTEITTHKLDKLPAKIHVGLAATAHSTSGTVTAKFGSVSVARYPWPARIR